MSNHSIHHQPNKRDTEPNVYVKAVMLHENAQRCSKFCARMCRQLQGFIRE